MLEFKRQTEARELAEQTQRRKMEIREENISDKIFEHICSNVEHNDSTKQSLLDNISKNGETTITLFDINYQAGPEFKHNIPYISSQFGDGAIETNFKEKFFNRSYTIQNPPFAGWVIRTKTTWTLAYEFLIIFPYKKVSIELSPPSFWSFRTFRSKM